VPSTYVEYQGDHQEEISKTESGGQQQCPSLLENNTGSKQKRPGRSPAFSFIAIVLGYSSMITLKPVCFITSDSPNQSRKYTLRSWLPEE
jgi:hypothetical protein